MLLAIDIGNTNITLGVFDGRRLESRGRISTDSHRLTDEYGPTITSVLSQKGIHPSTITSACMCSVVPPLTGIFQQVCEEYFKITPLRVHAGVRTGVRILYDNPRDVGADRVANAVAAFRLYGGPAIIVDFGTATVFDAISKDGDYLGGAIAPGVAVAAEALHQSTSQLQRVELKPPKTAIGRDTVSSLQSGLMLGYLSLVEGMVQRFKTELGQNSIVIATGGIASMMARETHIFDAENSDLTLIGLSMIYEMNQEPAGKR